MSRKLTSESSTLIAAYYAGMFEDALNEKVDFTVFGRMGTGTFDFSINNRLSGLAHSLSVKKAQCEIDAGLEGERTSVVVEAKNQIPKDFLIRQLYFPFRVWDNRLDKRIVPVFMTYANDIFSFHIGHFKDVNAYNSLEWIAHKRYSIVPRSIELGDVRKLMETTYFLPEPTEENFPQADSFARVLDLMTQLFNASQPILKKDFTDFYSFTERQTNYYIDAARYLGFVERIVTEDNEIAYQLTRLGKSTMQMKARNRNLAIVKQALKFRVFHGALELYFKQSRVPSKEQVVALMKEVKVKGLNTEKSTMRRRASTVVSWLNWMLELTST